MLKNGKDELRYSLHKACLKIPVGVFIAVKKFRRKLFKKYFQQIDENTSQLKDKLTKYEFMYGLMN